ncbi:hypothetical protein HJC23_006076 [Cyclotella cryptica]|uniref:Protein-S-isoprenylcysteine O-methyltransferase n=1 Tax=Cyclotella cryptica TaxID=29204 RepID=A0ABD3QK87_9STRA|eukprot:CCRYP_004529-RA/>CCRYP_004529-RA protein AED:0.00 eAED:0.00 QI:297/-1/1/1/-1/1/1/184/244
MTVRKIILLLVSFTGIGCSAFAPPSLRFTPTALIQHQTSMLPIKKNKSHFRLYAVDDPNNTEPTPSFMETLATPEVMMANVLEGKFGQRGEPYVLAQFTLFLLLAIGYIPFLGDATTPLLGSLFLLSGLFVVYRSSADLKNNLSPWPVPIDRESGRGSLVNTGIYSYVRHPMYTGVLLGMVGLSIATDSIVRMILTCALYYVLDRKSEFEEEKLGEVYGEEYEKYKEEVTGKFFPSDFKKVLML